MKTVWDSDVDSAAWLVEYTLENDWADLKAILMRFDGIRITTNSVDYARPFVQFKADNSTTSTNASISTQYTRYNVSSTFNNTTGQSNYSWLYGWSASTSTGPAGVGLNDLDEAWSAETNFYFAPNVAGNKAGVFVTRGQHRQNKDTSPTSPYTDARMVSGFNNTYSAFNSSNKPNYYFDDAEKPTILSFGANLGQSTDTWTAGKISIQEITL